MTAYMTDNIDPQITLNVIRAIFSCGKQGSDSLLRKVARLALHSMAVFRKIIEYWAIIFKKIYWISITADVFMSKNTHLHHIWFLFSLNFGKWQHRDCGKKS